MVFWDMKPCRLVYRYRSFGETCRLHLQVIRKRGEQASPKSWHSSTKLQGGTSYKGRNLWKMNSRVSEGLLTSTAESLGLLMRGGFAADRLFISHRVHESIPCVRLHWVLQGGRRTSPDDDRRSIDSITASLHNTISKLA